MRREKPRIVRFAGRWYCELPATRAGYGKTPLGAYKSWLKYLQPEKNV